ncbi:MAG: CoA-binding protein [Calditrichaeota bacterium]|nr:MAG: CoA-binding protein [Calditrichota bacterium]
MPHPNRAKKRDFDSIFYPQSIAVVGANKVTGTVPHDILVNILKSDFQGIVYPVSPREKSIGGLKAFKYVSDISDPIDLAVIVFPSSVVHMALEQCGQKGVKSAVIISAGFKEVGGEGIMRENQLREIADKYGISFIGPNCLGVINTDPRVKLDASFARKMPQEGTIGFLSQSGALCTAVLDYAQAKHIGFSKFVSFGNKADITEIDLLNYLRDDPKTRVILIYLEEISDGRALLQTAQEIISKTGKPILAIKSGRTAEGASAAASHTGSLVGSDEVIDAAFRQVGIIRCWDIEEMFNKAIAMAYQPLPHGNRIAIVTNAGGPGVLTTDATIKEGLRLAAFSETTTDILGKSLPKTANIKNPVDVIGDARADRYHIAVSQVLNDPQVDGVFVILTPQSMTDIEAIAREICSVAGQSEKPLYTSFMGENDVAQGISILQRNQIPHYILPESMPKAFNAAFRFHKQSKAKIVDHGDSCESPHAANARAILDEAVRAGRHILLEDEATPLLALYGLPVLKNGVASSAEEAAVLAKKIGFPVAMKILSTDIVHKFDVKGVHLDIRDEERALQSYHALLTEVSRLRPDAEIKGVLVSPMIPKGEEVILGVKRDPAFGPVIMFGLGGIFVELFRDVQIRVAPVNLDMATEMIHQIQSAGILTGSRGRIPRDIESIAHCLTAMSRMAIECPQIKELDINPLIVGIEKQSSHIADAKIML